MLSPWYAVGLFERITTNSCPTLLKQIYLNKYRESVRGEKSGTGKASASMDVEAEDDIDDEVDEEE